MGRSRDDDGAILVMAIVLVLVFGALAGGLASFGAASFGHTRVVRTQTALLASAEGGLRVTIDQLTHRRTLCGSSVGPPQPVLTSTNSAAISVTCAGIGTSPFGLNNWALILTAVGADGTHPSLDSRAPGSPGRGQRINGSVYMAVPASIDANNLSLVAGDLWYPSADCAIAPVPAPDGMTITPPARPLCTAVGWRDLLSPVALPPIPVTRNPAGHDEFVPGCRVFVPGTYTAPPVLAKGDNYFVSGDYYFDFDGPLVVKQAVVIGGRIDPTLGDAPYLDPGQCAAAAEHNEVLAAETSGPGVTWFLGGAASIDVQTEGRVELFRRRQGSQAVSVMAVPTPAVAPYRASTLTLAGGPPLLDVEAGAGQEVVIHGLLDAPLAQLRLGNVTNRARAQMLGGVRVAGIEMKSSGDATGFAMALASPPTRATMLLTSTATDRGGSSASAQAVVEHEPSRYVIDAALSGSTFTSPTGAFAADDVGSSVTGVGIPALATIASVTSPTQATLSTAVTAPGTNVSVVIQTARVAVNSWRRI